VSPEPPRGCVLRPHGRRANARLAGRRLPGENLAGVNLVGATLTAANLTRVNLNGANLARAGLLRARLVSAHLVHADLAHANLSRANLSGANLNGANVSGAALAGAIFAGARASGVRGTPRSRPSGYRLRAGNIMRQAPTVSIRHVVWVLMENDGLSGVIGNPQTPYTNALARSYGLATNYSAVAHPSLPNYIARTSGSTQGIADDNNPSSHRLAVPSIFSQLGSNWRSVEEAMPSNCDRSNSGLYAVRHNPAAYFTNIVPACATQDTPFGAIAPLSAAFTFVTPNICNDMHSCPVAAGDTWLRRFVPGLLTSPEYAFGGTVIVVVWDESAAAASNRVPMIAIWPWTTRVTSGAAFTHYSLLRTTEDLLGVPALGNARAAASMAAAFNLP
jgi:hypothetical protein